jgi:hypothetical protein
MQSRRWIRGCVRNHCNKCARQNKSLFEEAISRILCSIRHFQDLQRCLTGGMSVKLRPKCVLTVLCAVSIQHISATPVSDFLRISQRDQATGQFIVVFSNFLTEGVPGDADQDSPGQTLDTRTLIFPRLIAGLNVPIDSVVQLVEDISGRTKVSDLVTLHMVQDPLTPTQLQYRVMLQSDTNVLLGDVDNTKPTRFEFVDLPKISFDVTSDLFPPSNENPFPIKVEVYSCPTETSANCLDTSEIPEPSTSAMALIGAFMLGVAYLRFLGMGNRRFLTRRMPQR